MKILVCSSGFNSFSERRVDVFQFDQAKALADRGHDVRIATLDMRSVRRWRSPFSATYEQGGLKVFTVNSYCGRVPASIINPAGRRAAKKAVRKACSDGWKPDVIHAHFTDMGYFFCDAAKELGVPYVITEHSSAMLEKEVDETVKLQASYAYPKADVLIAVGESLSNRIKDMFGVDAIVVPNMVDFTAFDGDKGENITDKTKTTFTAAGYLVYRKGFDVLLQAFANLTDKNTVLNILGDGEQREALLAQANALGIEDRVNFHGMFKREDFSRVLEGSDCFVLASRNETFGVVYIEAMAKGVPVIATICGGPEGFVTDELGLLVEVDDVDMLTKAMQYMCEHSDEYDRELIKNKVRDSFSPDTVACRLENIYQELLK